MDGGGLVLDGREVSGASPERAVVFQSPNLLPWLTALENVTLGLEQRLPDKSVSEVNELAKDWLCRVGLAHAFYRKPAELSQGMQQRVGIARAFALQPKVLLLDEPFGMLDSLTRFELQDVLLDVWQNSTVTTVLVTHDVDEAVRLSDRIVMMTNGPAATIGEICNIELPRPREQHQLVSQPRYYEYRNRVIEFLESQEHRIYPNGPREHFGLTFNSHRITKIRSARFASGFWFSRSRFVMSFSPTLPVLPREKILLATRV